MNKIKFQLKEIKQNITFDQAKGSIVSEGQITPYEKKILHLGKHNKYHSKNNS